MPLLASPKTPTTRFVFGLGKKRKAGNIRPAITDYRKSLCKII
jgi:hypothetical protein